MTITVYGRSDTCMACRATQRYLKAHHIEFEYRNVDEDADAMAYVQALGVLEVPVVRVQYDEERGEFWSGFRPDRLRGLLAHSGPAVVR